MVNHLSEGHSQGLKDLDLTGQSRVRAAATVHQYDKRLLGEAADFLFIYLSQSAPNFFFQIFYPTTVSSLLAQTRHLFLSLLVSLFIKNASYGLEQLIN